MGRLGRRRQVGLDLHRRIVVQYAFTTHQRLLYLLSFFCGLSFPVLPSGRRTGIGRLYYNIIPVLLPISVCTKKYKIHTYHKLLPVHDDDNNNNNATKQKSPPTNDHPPPTNYYRNTIKNIDNNNYGGIFQEIRGDSPSDGELVVDSLSLSSPPGLTEISPTYLAHRPSLSLSVSLCLSLSLLKPPRPRLASPPPPRNV